MVPGNPRVQAWGGRRTGWIIVRLPGSHREQMRHMGVKSGLLKKVDSGHELRAAGSQATCVEVIIGRTASPEIGGFV